LGRWISPVGTIRRYQKCRPQKEDAFERHSRTADHSEIRILEQVG
jgi:hypothetical protein